jgi:DNA-binding Lrp family transcriptional regulator
VLKPLKEDKDAPVLKHLANNPGTSVLAAATALGQDEENTRKQLKRLKDEGKVDTRPVPGSRARGWFIAADR